MDAGIDAARTDRRARLRIRVDGIVQGVGFRPFVHSLAGRIMLSGFVRNDSRGVVIEVEGARDRLCEFIDKLQSEAPPLAAIERIESLTIPLAGDGQFEINESDGAGDRDVLIAPDIATRDDCVREIFTRSDRRFRYPFNNCADAVERLGAIADCFLIHDRPIHIRTDDSVIRLVRGREYPIRRSRGYAPGPLMMPLSARRPILACGAELKSTFCLVKGNRAFVSHHIGDLENYETWRAYVDGIDHFRSLFGIEPQMVAHDLHPEYLSTKYAMERKGVQLIGIQHHHAHVASCLRQSGAGTGDRCGPGRTRLRGRFDLLGRRISCCRSKMLQPSGSFRDRFDAWRCRRNQTAVADGGLLP